MTLFRQMLALIVVCFSINLVGVLWLEFDSTRNYLANQLESDLNNTSTSLSMALSPHLAEEDEVLIESTLNAYFDGGFYEQIELTLLSSGKVINKQLPIYIKGVPKWFVDLELLKVPQVSTTITSGWMQAGELTIKGHPGFAYKQLWDAFVAMSSWIFGLSIIVIFFTAAGINMLLRPLERIRIKAEQIQERNFGEALELPATRELRSVTDAINRMTDKLKEQFSEEARLHEKLKHQAFQDATTGLGNRAFFNRQFKAWLDEQHNGALIMLELLGLDEVKKNDGFNKRDELVKMASQFMQNTFNPDNGHVTTRLSANEFAIIVNGVDREKLESQLKQLNQVILSPNYQSNFYTSHICNIGAVLIQQNAEVSQLLSMVDTALQTSRNELKAFEIVQQTESSEQTIQKTDLKQMVLSAINNSSLGFARQPVFNFDNDKQPMHFEAFAQLLIQDAGPMNAASFISVLDEFELGKAFDKKVVELILAHMKTEPENTYAVNLTASALKSDNFIEWLINKLKTSTQDVSKICFEFSEESVIYNLEKIEPLCAALRQLGIEFGVDRVGRNFSSLSYLQSIHPNYVKIDHAYTQMALSNKNDAYFVGSLCTTIHNLDVAVIATRVENEEQLQVLKEYHFDAYQGYIYKPEAFSVSVKS